MIIVGSPGSAKDEAEIVGGHLKAFDEVQSVLPRQVCHRFQVADTPFRIALPEILVKNFVTWSGVGTVLLVGPVEIENSSGREYAPCPGHQSLSRLPGRDVDQVDRANRISPLHRPFRGGRIKEKWSEQVRQA